MTTKLDQVLYTAHTHTTGGRDGQAKSDDGRLNVTLSSPGTSGTGTNPRATVCRWLLGLFHRRAESGCRHEKSGFARRHQHRRQR